METALSLSSPDLTLDVAFKEWAVAIRALREGHQILLIRKGGIREDGGEFSVASRRVLLFPTYLHAEEQAASLQPCYGAWQDEEARKEPKNETVRFDAWAEITDIFIVQKPDALYELKSQHIYGDSFLKKRIESEPAKPLYGLCLRTYNLPQPAVVPVELDYYGCKSWINLTAPLSLEGATPALSDRTYEERVRVTRRFLTHDSPHPPAPSPATGEGESGKDGGVSVTARAGSDDSA